MVGTTQLDRVRSIVDSIGARLVLMGDPRQLGAVGAGGAMGLVARPRRDLHPQSDVRRFAEDWEAAGVAAAAGRRPRSAGRLRPARAARRGRDDGRRHRRRRPGRCRRPDRRALDVVVTADTNEDAARIADAVREHLVAAGVVEADGVPLGRTGSLAGIGDEIMTRQNDYDLGVINRQRFRVVGTGTDSTAGPRCRCSATTASSASCPPATSRSTSSSPTARPCTPPRAPPSTAATSSPTAAPTPPRSTSASPAAATATPPSSPSRRPTPRPPTWPRTARPRPTARSVLEDGLERDEVATRALVHAELDAAREASTKTVSGGSSSSRRAAVRARMEADLDRLVADGAALRRGPGAAGRRPVQRAPVPAAARRRAGRARPCSSCCARPSSQRSLEGAQSVAQVLSARITSAHDIDRRSAARGRRPARLPAAHAEYIEQLHELADDRARSSGPRSPSSSRRGRPRHLGAVPADAVERLEWEAKAGAVAAYREAVGFEDAGAGPAQRPRPDRTEKRAAWWNAWDALGRPSETARRGRPQRRAAARPGHGLAARAAVGARPRRRRDARRRTARRAGPHRGDPRRRRRRHRARRPAARRGRAPRGRRPRHERRRRRPRRLGRRDRRHPRPRRARRTRTRRPAA